MRNRLIKAAAVAAFLGPSFGQFTQSCNAQGRGSHPVQPLRAAPADYSDTPLTPQSNPAASAGNDLLLAEDANAIRGANGTAYPETWSMTLNYTETYSGSGNVNPQYAQSVNWGGPETGPTGTYAAGTIGDGKHTENTLADIHTEFVPGSGILVTYQYTVLDNNYDSNGKDTQSTFYLTPYSYQM